jgi:hypothetical protein
VRRGLHRLSHSWTVVASTLGHDGFVPVRGLSATVAGSCAGDTSQLITILAGGSSES